MHLAKKLLVIPVAVLTVIACSTSPSTDPNAPAPVERLGQASQALVALGQACVTNAQCAPGADAAGHCVDTVCCDTSCGGGARDNVACSNVYGTVPGLVPGTCKTLANGDPCAALEAVDQGNACRFRATKIAAGACPAPNGNVQEQACYPCTDSSTCGPGRPVCDPGTVVPHLPLDTYFMLDRSGSMGNDCAIGSNGNSKWCYATNALATYFQSAGAAGNRAAIQYFTLPNSDCATGSPHDVPAVDLTLLPVTAASALVTNIAAAAPGNGGTEIESAARGVAKFTAAHLTAGRTEVGVIITDGDPNGCSGNLTTLAKILSDHLAATGIRTFVVGMTGATPANLEILATGGGAPAHPGFCEGGAASCHYYSVGNGNAATFDAVFAAIQNASSRSCEECQSNNGGGGAFACPTAGAPKCVNGNCVQCASTADCAGIPGTVCNPSTNTCVGCVTSVDCPGSAPICNPQHICITNCITSSECPGDAPICNPASKVCVECVVNGDCPAGEICNSVGKCVLSDGGTKDSGTDGGKTDGGLPGPDSGASGDGGASGGDGGSRGAEAGLDDTDSIEGGGCACVTAGQSPLGTNGAPALVGLGVAAMLTLRRRSRASH
jgi:MYXO-CTERM domain-containing protein